MGGGGLDAGELRSHEVGGLRGVGGGGMGGGGGGGRGGGGGWGGGGLGAGVEGEGGFVYPAGLVQASFVFRVTPNLWLGLGLNLSLVSLVSAVPS